MNIEKRISQLEQKHPSGSELYFNCIGWDGLLRMQDLLEKSDLSDTEYKELQALNIVAKRDARKEFLDQYDKPEPFDLRTVFNDFKDYQKERGRVTSLGHAVIPAYPQFQQFLTDNGYQIQ